MIVAELSANEALRESERTLEQRVNERTADLMESQRELALALSTLEIKIPPLRERRADIPFLAQQFLEDFNAAGGRQLSGFTTDALDRLCALPWPGELLITRPLRCSMPMNCCRSPKVIF